MPLRTTRNTPNSGVRRGSITQNILSKECGTQKNGQNRPYIGVMVTFRGSVTLPLNAWREAKAPLPRYRNRRALAGLGGVPEGRHALRLMQGACLRFQMRRKLLNR